MIFLLNKKGDPRREPLWGNNDELDLGYIEVFVR